MPLNPLDKYCPKCKAELLMIEEDSKTGDQIFICSSGECVYETRVKGTD